MKDLVDHCEFDTIYHEHLCYFSLTAARRLIARHGLAVVRRRAHADPRRLAAGLRRDTAGATTARRRVAALLAEEERGWGVDQPASYRAFARARRATARRSSSTCSRACRSDGAAHRRLRRRGQGQHAPQLLRHRRRTARLRRRPQHGTSRAATCPARAIRILAPSAARPRAARLRAAPRLELRRRDPRAAGRVPPTEAARVHRARRPRSPDGCARDVIDGVQVDPAAAHPRRARHDLPHAPRDRPALPSSSARSTSRPSTGASSRAGIATAR